MATYDGVNIFGPSATITTQTQPRADQRNAFFGLNGYASLDGGGRGFVSQAKGILVADSLADLATLINNIYGYNDGVERELVDNLGLSWRAVKLVDFRRTSRTYYDPGKGACVEYEITLEHMI